MSVTKWIIHFILNASPWVIFDSFPKLKESWKFADLATKKETGQKKLSKEPEAYTPLPHIPLPKKQLLKILWIMAESSGEVSSLWKRTSGSTDLKSKCKC